MRKVTKLFKKIYDNVLRSIALYPVLLSFGFLVLAIVTLTLENWELTQSIKKKIPYLFIQDYETARSILSTLIGGIISLTVFSFSMVMVVLSQASSNFSPRLLPGLISNKKNQLILGVYIGTLLYCIIILISLGAYGVDANSLGLSTMFAALFGILCIALFVYFIHSISRAVQIHNIITRIYRSSNKYLDRELKKQSEEAMGLSQMNTEDWMTIKSIESGYFRGFDIDLMPDSLKSQNPQVSVLPYVNQHLWKGMPLLKIKDAISEEDSERLIFCTNISSDRHEGDKGIGGMIKLMEIAVKAMSPGINDPGTAIDAVNKLGVLLGKFLEFPKFTSQSILNGKCILIQNNIPARELMRIIVQPIRLYSKHDSSVIYELIIALKFICDRPNISKENKDVVSAELVAVNEDISNNIKNPRDKEHILALLTHPKNN